MSRTLKPRNIGTVSDAAKRWCVSEKTIRRMINAGELTGYYPTPRALRVDLAELDQLMESRATRKVVA
ncbi:helix-turn-helix domain-containing protein [Corynebacterium sp. ACRPX]|uniref:helix-turn-helix domain-containing protein n=1 Tax=Corynebacterium sp. ACRPX TaxID=2918185 RepID=UPI001EF5566B|nr:helix-turn-helix domain-containing protein [Corynebacterium sp. ACRPX]MCG7245618.1 helix-turn-helix domain-containing protein [Corynebacterium sp. ACRPX]